MFQRFLAIVATAVALVGLAGGAAVAAPASCDMQQSEISRIDLEIMAHNGRSSSISRNDQAAVAAYNAEADRLDFARTSAADRLRSCEQQAGSYPAIPAGPLPSRLGPQPGPSIPLPSLSSMR